MPLGTLNIFRTKGGALYIEMGRTFTYRWYKMTSQLFVVSGREIAKTIDKWPCRRKPKDTRQGSLTLVPLLQPLSGITTIANDGAISAMTNGC